MNINQRLAKYLETSNPLDDSELNTRLIKFLNSPMTLKQELAQSLVKEIVKPHNKDQLVNHIAELYEVESATMSLTGKRDHVVHAINTFILGLFINHNYLNQKVDLFQWKLASLFHDIAYPLEISQKIINRYFEKITHIQNSLNSHKPSPSIDLVPKNLILLSNRLSAHKLLQSRISDWKIDLNLKQKYDEMVFINFMDLSFIGFIYLTHLLRLGKSREARG